MRNKCYKNFCSKHNLAEAFKLLGLSSHASKDEVKLAYYKLAKVYHPDSSSINKILLQTRRSMKKCSKK